MELTDTERMLLELLQEREMQMQRESQARRMRFMTGVAERIGIPAQNLVVDQQTGAITDRRVSSLERAADIAEAPVDLPTSEVDAA